jgi:hypothetical protein
MDQINGLAAVQAIHQALIDGGMPRTSSLNGGEINGWTTHFGSTGFSVRITEEGRLDWHIVISGLPLLSYRDYMEHNGDESYELHEPINPEVLYPRIKGVFEAFDLVVKSIRNSGHQTMWDDDVEYNVLTDYPDWLESVPQSPIYKRA